MIAIFLIAAAVFVSAEDAVSTTSETTSAFSSSGTSGSFSSSNPQTFAPGLSGSFSGGNYQGYYGGSSVDINAVCRDRKDFVVQIAPGGCTPAVVRSDLLEEQDVLVYCKLQAVMVNPTIAAEKMSNVILTPHTASATIETRERMSELVAQNIIDVFEGREPVGLVN